MRDGIGPGVTTPERRVENLRPEGLRLSAAELDFLPRLGPLLPTPRSAKRMVNLYRMLRIGIPDAGLPHFTGDAGGGPYQAAALLLATIVGLPQEGRRLLIALRSANPRDDIGDFLRNSGPQRLTDLIETIDKNVTVHREMSTYQQWGRTVARFSFATYDLFPSD